MVALAVNELFANRAFKRPISFELARGESLVVVGINGSGKSTLLRILAGILTPDLGDITWENPSIKRLYLGHDNGLRLGLTVLENLQAAVLHADANRASIATVLIAFNLTTISNTLAIHLSAGQKRRVALARLSLLPADVWILDEPLAALDIETQKMFAKLLADFLKQGGLAILSTHQAVASTKEIVL